jgi:hypothetical protein
VIKAPAPAGPGLPREEPSVKMRSELVGKEPTSFSASTLHTSFCCTDLVDALPYLLEVPALVGRDQIGFMLRIFCWMRCTAPFFDLPFLISHTVVQITKRAQKMKIRREYLHLSGAVGKSRMKKGVFFFKKMSVKD